MTGKRRLLSISPVLLLGLAVGAAAVLAAADAPDGAAGVSGPVAAVDLENRTLTVRDAKAGEVTLAVDEQTVFVLDGDDQAILDDVFEGDEVVSATVRKLNSGRLYLVRAEITSRPTPDEGE